MSKFLLWYLLAWVAGSPLGALAVLLVLWWASEQAIEVLRPNLEAGDDDIHTAFLFGAALARAGAHEQAERVLGIARALDSGYRLGEIDLELARSRLARGDLAGTRQALERLVEARPGTVQGRVLLARALEGLGDVAGARRLREEAWREYTSLPRFRRREERPWAWRIRPWRPAAVAVVLLLLLALGAQAALRVTSSLEHPAEGPADLETLRPGRGSPGRGPGRRLDRDAETCLLPRTHELLGIAGAGAGLFRGRPRWPRRSPRRSRTTSPAIRCRDRVPRKGRAAMRVAF